MTRAEQIQAACAIPYLVVATHGDDCGTEDCQNCQFDAEFSPGRCELCGALPGSRYTVAQIFPGTDEEPLYYSACQDCLAYIANGDLPGEN